MEKLTVLQADKAHVMGSSRSVHGSNRFSLALQLGSVGVLE
jgi:hypothetical protein